MDPQFYARTNEILRANASRGLVDYKGSGACKTTPMKVCVGKPGTVKRKTALKKLTEQNNKLLSKRSGSKTVAKRKPSAKKATVKKAPVKRKPAVKKAPAKRKPAVKKAPAKRKPAVKKATVKKAPKKKTTKRKTVKGSGFAGGCHDCPHCGGAL